MPRFRADSIAVGQSALVAITGHDIALLVNGVQYGEDVGVLTKVYIPEDGQVEICMTTKQIDGTNHLRLMDSQGKEFVGDLMSGGLQNIGGAISNFFRAMGYGIDDVYSQETEISGPIFRLPSNGNFEPAGFRYGGNQISYVPPMSRMSEGDEFAVFVNGLYVLNRLERAGSTLVYRTYVLPCNPAVEDSGLLYSYQGSYNTGFNIDVSESCEGNLSAGALSDWWYQLGVEPLPYQFEQRVYYTDRMRLMPLLFIEY